MAADDPESLQVLAPERIRALEVLVSGGTAEAAAKAAGASIRSVHYWARTVEFQAAFADFQEAARSRVRLRLAGMVDRATDAVADCLGAQAGDDAKILSVRRQTARDVFEVIGVIGNASKSTAADSENGLGVVDEQKLEAALRARGWVKLSEVVTAQEKGADK